MGQSALGSLPAAGDIEYEFDVSISYHSSDLAHVSKIADKLKERLLNVWWDKWSISPGSVWMTELSKGIVRSRTTAAFLGPDASSRSLRGPRVKEHQSRASSGGRAIVHGADVDRRHFDRRSKHRRLRLLCVDGHRREDDCRDARKATKTRNTFAAACYFWGTAR
jgi:TIR domain-containing protein